MIEVEQPAMSVSDMQKEFRNEVRQSDRLESLESGKVAPPALQIPPQLVGMVVRMENGLILSTLTKNCSASTKERAREALEPTKEELESTGEFLNQLIERYAPTAMADPLALAGTMFAANFVMKVGTVMQLVKAEA